MNPMRTRMHAENLENIIKKKSLTNEDRRKIEDAAVVLREYASRDQPHFVDPVLVQKFRQSLEQNSKTVREWPEWKIRVLNQGVNRD